MKTHLKHFYLIVLVLCMGMVAQAQTVPDPAVLGADLGSAPALWPRISPEEYETFSFQVNNNGKVTSSPLVKVEVVLNGLDFDIPFDPAVHISVVQGNIAFTYAWDASAKKLTCTLAGSFPKFFGNTIRINKLVVLANSPKPNNLVGGTVTLVAPAAQNSSTTNDETSTHTYTSTRISGSIWDDTNGNAAWNMAENHVTPGIMWANLVDASNNTVQYSKMVDVDGKYVFPVIELLTDYKVILTTTEQTIGNTLTSAEKPAGWFSTGVNLDGQINPNNRTGILYFASSTLNYLNQNFGLEQIPTAHDHAANFPALGQDELYPLSPNYSLAPQPSLSGTDPEEGSMVAGKTFIITSLPAGANLYYGFTKITAADVAAGTGTAVISNYDIDKLGFSSTQLGLFNTFFTYVVVDAAGARSPQATYTITASGVLPLAATGLQLKATLANKTPQLTWTTLTEQNTSFFEVERSIDGGATYAAIGNVAAAGNSNSKKSYHLADANIAANKTVYYRVKLNSHDGKKTQSNTVVLSTKQLADISVFPNPAQQFIMIKGLAGNSTIMVLDMNGRIMQKAITAGSSHQLGLSGYAAGTYMVQVIENGAVISSQKFVKN